MRNDDDPPHEVSQSDSSIARHIAFLITKMVKNHLETSKQDFMNKWVMSMITFFKYLFSDCLVCLLKKNIKNIQYDNLCQEGNMRHSIGPFCIEEESNDVLWTFFHP